MFLLLDPNNNEYFSLVPIEFRLKLLKFTFSFRIFEVFTQVHADLRDWVSLILFCFITSFFDFIYQSILCLPFKFLFCFLLTLGSSMPPFFGPQSHLYVVQELEYCLLFFEFNASSAVH